MFIREVTHTDRKNNTCYTTYKVVESVRTQRGPRQRTVLNLGTDFNLPKDLWKDLADRIEEIATGQMSLVEHPKEVESLARKFARKIVRQHSSVVTAKPEASADYVPDYQTVDINSLDHEESRSVGAEHVVYHAIQELGIDNKLTELHFTRPQLQAAIGVIAGRLIDPGSERATHIWLQSRSALDELMGADFSGLSQDRVYKASDMLLGHKEAIEEHLTSKERSLFNLQERIMLYDLTNTFFEGSGRYNAKAHFARSKEKRTDCPLVTLGLVLDGDGFPKRSKVFAGNVGEATTLQDMIDELSCAKPLFKPTIVLDAGIATKGNVGWLKEHGYTYIGVSRTRDKDIPTGLSTVTIENGGDNVVSLSLAANEETDEIELYCHSTSKEKKEQAIKSLSCQRFEEGLEQVQGALSKKHGTKHYDKVLERVYRLKERFKRVAYRYEITVTRDAGTNKAASVNWSPKEMEDTPGTYCLRTNRNDLKEKQIWDIYTMLTDVEDAFRCMKSDLGLRPVHHQNEPRADGHLFITVLAYHILHSIRFKLRSKNIHQSWETIRKTLSTHTRISTTMKTKDGKLIHVRKPSRPEQAHRDIYTALDMPSQAGKTIKSIL